MSKNIYSFTSESVSEGHPDKVADQISDAILDNYLHLDKLAKVACECLITRGNLVIAGEVTSDAKVDVISIAKAVLRNIGYDNDAAGFNYSTGNYINLMHNQSREINQSVTDGGAGDQGLMFGYACRETPELMPLPIMLAHKIVEKLSELRKNKEIEWLLPDSKSQVTVLYKNDKPVKVEKVVLSTQHKAGVTQETIQKIMIEQIIKPVIENYLDVNLLIRLNYHSVKLIDQIVKPVIDDYLDAEYIINPSGSFTIGGPHADTGLTGRKIIVDTYGGSCPHGGGAFSGKDPSKVDRSAAYAARYIAKHVVASGLSERCTVQLSYAIGKAEPTSIYVYTHGTGKESDDIIAEKINRLFDLTPEGIINTLNLRQPSYMLTTVYGHFGKSKLPWEVLDQSILNQLNPTDFKTDEYVKEIRDRFQGETDKGLVESINCVGKRWHSRERDIIYLHELRSELRRRNWDFCSITNASGGFNLDARNPVYLDENNYTKRILTMAVVE
jgi:S-adenosylmethionine synthetase